MKKNSMETLVAYFRMQNSLPNDVADAVDEMKAELAKNAEKANANRALYASAHDVVMSVMSEKPMTIAEIYDTCSADLPEGFSKSKVQYALTNYWKDEIVKIENPKGANEYRKA